MRAQRTSQQATLSYTSTSATAAGSTSLRTRSTRWRGSRIGSATLGTTSSMSSYNAAEVTRIRRATGSAARVSWTKTRPCNASRAASDLGYRVHRSSYAAETGPTLSRRRSSYARSATPRPARLSAGSASEKAIFSGTGSSRRSYGEGSAHERNYDARGWFP